MLSSSPHDERGQTTAEYALVLLVAAAVAVVAIAWAAKSGKVAELLDGVLDKILGQL
jgi:Flp pilus assembly pilin Flp